MIEIIAVINQKGGVGKSTTAHNIGAALIKYGYKILFIDLDPQCNLTSNFETDSEKDVITVYDALMEPELSEKTIKKTPVGDIIPASPLLSGADTTIISVGKEYRLRESFNIKFNYYDYIIIDTPPALGILTINALAACTSVIIPAGADVYSLQGVKNLSATIDTVKKYCNPNLKIKGVLITRYNSRAVLSRDIAEILEETAKKLGTKLFSTAIREGIAIKEAQANKQSVVEYAPKSNPAIDYLALTREILES